MPKSTKSTPLSAEGRPIIRAASKQILVKNLLARDEGASLDELIAATGWLPHTTRAALTGLRKKGFAIDKTKVDGVTRYRHVASA